MIKLKGWLYCSGMIPPIKPVSRRYPDSSYTDWAHYSCRHRMTESHWHRIYETDEGETKINWEYIHYEVLLYEGRCEEYELKVFYADNQLCQSCQKKLTEEGRHSPYWIPLVKRFYWCTECWNKFYPEGHIDYACGMAREPKVE